MRRRERTYLNGPSGISSFISNSHQQSDPFSRNKPAGKEVERREVRSGQVVGVRVWWKDGRGVRGKRV